MKRPVIELDLEKSDFLTILDHKLPRYGLDLPEILRLSIIECLERKIATYVDLGTVLSHKVDVTVPADTLCLEDIRGNNGVTCKWLNIQLDTPNSLRLNEGNIKTPRNLQWLPRAPEYGYYDTLELKEYTNLKTRNRYKIKVYKSFIDASFFDGLLHKYEDSCNCSLEMLAPIPKREWDWVLEFECKICGRTFFCHCFKKALEKQSQVAQEEYKNYSKNGWPHRLLNALSRSKYRKHICHLCTGKASNLKYCHPMYGSSVKVHYGAYIAKARFEMDVDEAEAENHIRDILGVPRIGEGWINETQLHKIICLLFPSLEILREASPPWLGRQRLDIFIPELHLAIEYQGQQHYKPVEIFGGDVGLAETRKRDKIKRDLCKKNGIDLIYFKYTENITENMVAQRLKKYMPLIS